jgi:hypothetical protein
MQRHHYSWGGTIPELYSIDTIPASLEYFNCSNNGLSNLPTLPSSLKYLNASGNKSFYTYPPQSGQIVSMPKAYPQTPQRSVFVEESMYPPFLFGDRCFMRGTNNEALYFIFPENSLTLHQRKPPLASDSPSPHVF